MGRKPKTHPLTQDRIEWLQCYWETRAWKVPYDAALLRDIVNALLFRLDNVDPLGSSEIRLLVQTLAAREWHLEHFESRYEDENLLAKAEANLNTEIAQIAERRLSSKPLHHRSTLVRQRDLISWFELKYSFPYNQPNHRLDWLHTHGNLLLEHLAVFLCTCKYPPTLEPKFRQHEIAACSTPARLIRFLLASIHDIEPSSVENLLKPSRAQR